MYNNNSTWVTSNNNSKSKQNTKRKSKINAGDYKITIDNNYYKINPFELIEKLYKLSQNDSLSKDEKEVKMKKIVKDYVR